MWSTLLHRATINKADRALLRSAYRPRSTVWGRNRGPLADMSYKDVKYFTTVDL